MLAALVSGRAASELEDLPTQAAVAQVMDVLRSWYAPRGVTVPDPLQVGCLHGP